jgi:hypothetical protein
MVELNIHFYLSKLSCRQTLCRYRTLLSLVWYSLPMQRLWLLQQAISLLTSSWAARRLCFCCWISIVAGLRSDGTLQAVSHYQFMLVRAAIPRSKSR